MENFLYLVEISRKDLIVIFYDFYHQISLSSFHQSAHAKIEFNINIFLSGIDGNGSLYREKKSIFSLVVFFFTFRTYCYSCALFRVSYY